MLVTTPFVDKPLPTRLTQTHVILYELRISHKLYLIGGYGWTLVNKIMTKEPICI